MISTNFRFPKCIKNGEMTIGHCGNNRPCGLIVALFQPLVLFSHLANKSHLIKCEMS